jgi:carbon monoxide dehydrogenase subunit G
VELEKTLTVAAVMPRVWELLLDPKVMAGCVPGMQSVEVISDVEYLAEIRIKMSFITARFKVKTRIADSRPPAYLRIEGTGEDKSVASSMKYGSELFLTDLGGSATELRIKVKADVLGRLGSFGLSVMKTKADRMWDEFGANFAAFAERGEMPEIVVPAIMIPALADADVGLEAPTPVISSPPSLDGKKANWWQRLVGSKTPASQLSAERRLPSDIYVEIHHANGLVKVLWPSSAAAEAAGWLKDIR